MTTTDIDQWLASLELDNCNEIEYLYDSVISEMDLGPFQVNVNENQPRRIFITYKSPSSDTLMLTDSSKSLFVDKLKEKYCGGMPVDLFCSLQREK
jgi:hypothetical protein